MQLFQARSVRSELTLSDFVPDVPFRDRPEPAAGEADTISEGLIDGVILRALSRYGDVRGHLTELYSERDPAGHARPPHVYQVLAAPKSTRAWVYHRHQSDCLSFTNGNFQIALYDLREDSPTFRMLNVFRFGDARPTHLVIPPFVAHGVHNAGVDGATFVNMPTVAWLPEAPDKSRLAYPDPRLPFTFGVDVG